MSEFNNIADAREYVESCSYDARQRGDIGDALVFKELSEFLLTKETESARLRAELDTATRDGRRLAKLLVEEETASESLRAALKDVVKEWDNRRRCDNRRQACRQCNNKLVAACGRAAAALERINAPV